MELNYKASNISKAERTLGVNFFETLESVGDGMPSFTAILMILMAGGLSEEDADTLLDDKGIEGAMNLAVEAIGQAGFLTRLKLAQKAQNQQKPKASPTTGETTKA